MANLKYRWREVRPELISGLLYFLVRLIGSSLRMKLVGRPEDMAKKIICGWHGRSFAFANTFRNSGYSVIISHSRDGEMQSRIFSRLGFRIIRGSTGRGGVRALVEAIRELKAGGTMAMTPDGPRGPSHVVQDGVMVMAQKTGAELLPAAVSCRPRFMTKSWDKYIVPVPFGRGVILFGEPIKVAPDATQEEVEAVRLQLQNEMMRLEEEAERMMGY